MWNNFPSTCVSDDACELMFNTSYRGLLSVHSNSGVGGISIGLEVGCTSPSNTLGAILQLQYAQYIDDNPSAFHANFTNFVNIGTPIKIDNSTGWPCPGVLEEPAGTIPAYNPSSPCCVEIYELRVKGSGGGGVGDNPRFSFVHVFVNQIAQTAIVADAKQKSLGAGTGFIWGSVSTLPAAASITVTVSWLSTNITSTNCGVLHCWESGTSTDTILAGATLGNTVTVNYATTFTGTVKTLVSVQNPALAQGSIYDGDIDLLMAQTLTV